MKKRNLVFGLLLTSSLFVASCGNSKEEKKEPENKTETSTTSPTSGTDAATINMDEYKSLKGNEAVEAFKKLSDQYTSLLNSGDKDKAAALKKQLDELGAAYKSVINSAELKSLEQYNKAMENLDQLSGGKVNEAKEDMKKAVGNAKEEIQEATEHTKKDMEKGLEDMKSKMKLPQ